MRRVLVIGCGGAGKSTLARKLGERLGLEVIHLDVHFWRPGWVQTPDEEWIPIVDELIEKESWIIDGSFNGTLDRRMARADTVIFLDLPRWRCLVRAIKRLLKYRAATGPTSRPDAPNGSTSDS